MPTRRRYRSSSPRATPPTPGQPDKAAVPDSDPTRPGGPQRRSAAAAAPAGSPTARPFVLRVDRAAQSSYSSASATRRFPRCCGLLGTGASSSSITAATNWRTCCATTATRSTAGRRASGSRSTQLIRGCASSGAAARAGRPAGRSLSRTSHRQSAGSGAGGATALTLPGEAYLSDADTGASGRHPPRAPVCPPRTGAAAAAGVRSALHRHRPRRTLSRQMPNRSPGAACTTWRLPDLLQLTRRTDAIARGNSFAAPTT